MKGINSVKYYSAKIIFCVLLLCACNNDSANFPKEIKEKSWDIKKLETYGFKIFQQNPDSAILLFNILVDKYKAASNYKKAGITNLNISNIYDEYKNQADSALVYAQASLEIWHSLKDTMQQANLYKYIGLLKGKLNQGKAAQADIAQAISLYEQVGFEQGIMVSKFNLANVLLQEKQFEEAIQLYEQATEFWRSKQNDGRVFGNNLLGIELYRKTNDSLRVQSLFQENDSLQNKLKLNDFLKNKYRALREKELK